MGDREEAFNDDLAIKGFIKTSRPALEGGQRAALVRKGNEFFNAGRYEDAKRIFITARYTDGLIRLGDYHYKKNETLEAFRMYWLAPDRSKIDYLVERMATVVRGWLKDGDQ